MGELALDKVKKFFDAVYWFFMTICKIGFIGMVGITTYVIINRYFIKSPCTWGEPVVLMFMVYMSLISAALAIRKDTHIRMQVVDLFVPKKVICVMRGTAQVLIFFFSIFLIIYGHQVLSAGWQKHHDRCRHQVYVAVHFRSHCGRCHVPDGD